MSRNPACDAGHPDVVVFDVGGVIVRWQPLELMRRHFPDDARDDARARTLMGRVFQTFSLDADWAAFDRGEVEAEVLADRIAARTGLARAQVRSLIEAIPEHIQPMPESLAILEALRAHGRRLAVLSNMPRPYADHLEREHPCFGWFEHRTWSGRLGVMKPQREIFDHVRAAVGVSHPSKLLFVDDHAGNVEAARALGWRAIHFTSARDCAAALDAAFA